MAHNLGTLFDRLAGGSDTRAAGVERYVRSISPRPPGQQGLTTDPEGASASIRNSLDRTLEVTTGRITDAVAYTHMYKVQLDHGGPILACSDMVHTSLGVFGARQINTYTPGTGVIVLLFHQVEYGIIMGVHADHGINAFSAMSDMIVAGSNVGLHADDIHKFPFQLGAEGGIADWSAGRPFDSLPVGEWGATTETGLMVFLDPFLAMMRVDEETGLWVFYHDQMTRLAGHNLQVRAAGYELEALDDQGEFSSQEGWAPYLHEAKGCSGPLVDPLQVVDPTVSQQDQPWFSTVEPVEVDQQGFYRRQDFQGYLGQGGRRQLCAPAPSSPSVFTYPQELAHFGLAEENWCMDGMIATRSAKGILFVKRAVIPMPKRVRRPEDLAGDNPATYDFEGGSSHSVKDFPAATPTTRGLIQVAALQDVLARTFNWQGLHPFVYHEHDWYTPEDDDCYGAAALAAPIPFDDLAASQHLPLPTPTQVVVDPRYGSIAYYPNDSCFGLLDDGGVVLQGGCGEEFVMSQGSIYMRTPGDIWMLPGKSSITWAGWDIIQKANNAVDISANWDDVRIKAEKNVLVLGGNNGCGGVLIESKGEGMAAEVGEDDNIFTGIVLRSKEAPIIATTDKLFNVMPVAGAATEIRLNAGTGLILSESSFFYRRLHHAAIDDFGGSAVSSYWSNLVQLSSDLNVLGDVAASGAVGGAIAAVSTQQATTVGSIASADLRTRMTHLETNTEVQDLEFFFRDSAAMKAVGLTLHEGRWQRMAAIQGAGAAWTDNPVVSDATGFVSQAHPGHTTWLTNGYIRQDDLLLYSELTGLYVDRDTGDYEEPAWPTQLAESFTQFLIITNPAGA